jgi:succinate dehydrogenase / fumarate reductase, membrane anchor subunit
MHAWAWLFQRISAVILLVALGLHIVFLHYVNSGEPLKYSEIILRLKTPLFITLDILLLLFGIYHALYGLYSVFLDFKSGTKERALVLFTCVATGLAFTCFGLFGFLYIMKPF